MFLGESPLFRVPDVAGISSPTEVLAYVALGVAAGLFATVYVRGAALLRYRLGAFRLPVAVGPLLAGFVVGGVGLLAPDVLGTGYRAMDAALNLQFAWKTMAWLAAAKLLVAGLAFAVGTPGGLFAPTLFLGVMLGGAFGGLAPELLPMMPTSPSMLALAGMAGVFAGVFRAPMTAVFMTFELSGTSASILPAMITSTLGFLIARQFQRTSILDLVAAHEGANLPSSRLARAEEPLHVEDVLQPVSPAVLVIDGSLTLRDALAAANPATTHVLVSLPGHVWGVAPLDAAGSAGRHRRGRDARHARGAGTRGPSLSRRTARRGAAVARARARRPRRVASGRAPGAWCRHARRREACVQTDVTSRVADAAAPARRSLGREGRLGEASLPQWAPISCSRPRRGGSTSARVVSRRRSGAAVTGGAEHWPVRITVSASASDASCGSPSWWSASSARLTVGRDAVEEVALPQRVAQRERHGVQHLVAERDAVLPDGLAVGRLADRDHRDERPQRVDHEFAGRRRTRPS